jgi:hypothetical protein
MRKTHNGDSTLLRRDVNETADTTDCRLAGLLGINLVSRPMMSRAGDADY